MEITALVSMIFNAIFSIGGGLLLLSIRNQQQEMKSCKAEIMALQTKMAEEYVRRDDFSIMRSEITKSLERITDKIDRLVERS